MATATALQPSQHRSTLISRPATERIRGLNEKVLAAAKQTGTMSLDALRADGEQPAGFQPEGRRLHEGGLGFGDRQGAGVDTSPR